MPAPGVFVGVLVGRDVRRADDQQAVRVQHAGQPAHEGVLVFLEDVLDDVERHDRVEAPRIGGQDVHGAEAQFLRRDAGVGDLDRRRVEIHAQARTRRFSEQNRAEAFAASDVEHALARADHLGGELVVAEQVQQPARALAHDPAEVRAERDFLVADVRLDELPLLGLAARFRAHCPKKLRPWPPSSGTIDPANGSACRPARNATAWAISSGVPN